MLNGTMSMRKIGSAEVSAKKPLLLVPHAEATGPSSMHLMLIGAKTPLKAGDTVELTLQFKKAGDVTQRFPISAASDKAAGAEHHGHH
jgi:periplasmic copper chaperone A